MPTFAKVTHRRSNAVVIEYTAKVLAGALAAAVTVKDHPTALGGLTLEARHAQRIDDDIAGAAWA